MEPNVEPLFQPLEVRGMRLANRIVMPPMVCLRGIVSPEGIEWYREHAAGGPGLVIVEATPVTRFGEDLTVAALSRLVSAIHGEGVPVAIQLFPVSFTWPRVPGCLPAPADFTGAEIEQMLDNYKAAARMCMEAGFDGVEPHGAHDYPLNQFFSPADNARTDSYGGSLDNRMRLGIEVVRACREAIGPEALLLYRHTPVKEGSYGMADSLALAERLVGAGVDILDISPASADAPADLAAPFRSFGAPVIGVNEMDEVERALEALNEGRADLIAVARGLIADPEWPTKVREDRFDEITRCTRCNEKCFGNLKRGEPIACTQW